MEHKRLKSEMAFAMRDLVRALCAGLPEVEEKIDSFGHTSFRVNDKPFVMMGENEGGGGASIAFKTAPSTQEALLEQEADKYFKTPYIGHHGWVSLRLGMPVERQEIEGLLLEGYRRTAPKRLLKLLEGK